MSLKEQYLYKFEGFALANLESQLWRDKKSVSNALRAFETLFLLVEDSEKLISGIFCLMKFRRKLFCGPKKPCSNHFYSQKNSDL